MKRSRNQILKYRQEQYLIFHRQLSLGDGFGKEAIERGFGAIEDLIDDGNKSCVGNRVTAADLYIVPQVENAAVRFGVDMNCYPKIQLRANRLLAMDEVKKAHPMKQPDTPEVMPDFIKNVNK